MSTEEPTEPTATAVAPADTRQRRAVGLRHIVAAALGAALLVGPVTAYAASGFNDVPDDHPFVEDIAWMANTGISEGYPDGSFKPNDPVTRQAMSAFMRRLWNLQAGMYGTASVSTFTATGTMTEVVSTTVNVPEGVQGRFVVHFSAESTCYGGSSSGIGFDPACMVQVALDGTEMNGVGEYYWDSSDGGSETIDGNWDSNALVRYSGPIMTPGNHTVTVSAATYQCTSGLFCGGYTPPNFSMRYGVLTVQFLPFDYPAL